MVFAFAAYKELIPFVKPAPIDETETKKQRKHREGMKKEGDDKQEEWDAPQQRFSMPADQQQTFLS